jgi:hypothetical protein
MSKKRRYGEISFDFNKEDTNNDKNGYATTDPKRYTYLPSRNNYSIRLLTLFPSSDGPLLCCTLEEVEMDHSPYYEAISYVWGDNHTPASIVCDSEGNKAWGFGITWELL